MHTHSHPHAVDRSARGRAVRRVLYVTLALNWAVAAAKLTWGHMSGSVALWADGFHSLLDGSSNIVALVGIWMAQQPPDADHPYGHRKFESLTALGISGFLFFACFEILQQAVARLKGGATLVQSPALYMVTIGTLAVNVFVTRYERGAARKLGSEALRADSEHTMSDVWATLLVLVSFVCARFGWPMVDGIAGIVIACVIAWAGWSIVQQSMPTLADAALIPATDLAACAEEVAGVRECHRMRSRGTPDEVLVDLHILVDPMLPIAEAHQIGHRVENCVRERWPGVREVLVHVEPDEAGARRRSVR
jgi:cation diffusion facilitator family transporter